MYQFKQFSLPALWCMHKRIYLPHACICWHPFSSTVAVILSSPRLRVYVGQWIGGSGHHQALRFKVRIRSKTSTGSQLRLLFRSMLHVIQRMHILFMHILPPTQTILREGISLMKTQREVSEVWSNGVPVRTSKLKVCYFWSSELEKFQINVLCTQKHRPCVCFFDKWCYFFETWKDKSSKNSQATPGPPSHGFTIQRKIERSSFRYLPNFVLTSTSQVFRL